MLPMPMPMRTTGWNPVRDMRQIVSVSIHKYTTPTNKMTNTITNSVHHPPVQNHQLQLDTEKQRELGLKPLPHL